MLLCDHRFHAVLIYMYLLLHNSSITDIEYSPDYTAFDLPLSNKVR